MVDQNNSVGIQIRNLYKIFGPTPERFLEDVKGGMTKDELRDTHGHLNTTGFDVQIDITQTQHVAMGVAQLVFRHAALHIL